MAAVAERTPDPERPIPRDVQQRITVLQQAGLHKYAHAMLQEWRNCKPS